MTTAEIASLLHELSDTQLAEVCALLNHQQYGDVPQIYDTTQIILDCDYDAFTTHLNKVLHEIQDNTKTTNITAAIELSKMVTISTAHLSSKTRVLLSELDFSHSTFSIYNKEEYGWYIHLCDYKPHDKSLQHLIPDDLKACLDFAYAINCNILCLDCDGEIVDTTHNTVTIDNITYKVPSLSIY